MKAIIIGTTTCPYCVSAKRLAEEQNIDYDYKIIGQNISMEEAIELVGKPFRTVPQILVDEKHVGGFEDFNKFIHNKNINPEDFEGMEL